MGVIQAADKAWTDAIAIDPSNPNAWSNRGTSRLQFGRWQEARDDLMKAFELESKQGEPSGVSCLAYIAKGARLEQPRASMHVADLLLLDHIISH